MNGVEARQLGSRHETRGRWSTSFVTAKMRACGLWEHPCKTSEFLWPATADSCAVVHGAGWCSGRWRAAQTRPSGATYERRAISEVKHILVSAAPGVSRILATSNRLAARRLNLSHVSSRW